MEGCSPIRSCSPHQLSYSEPQHVSRSKPRVKVLSRISPAFICPILNNPRLQDNREAEEQLTCSFSLSATPAMELDPSQPPTCPPGDSQREGLDSVEPVKMEEQRVEEAVDKASGGKGTLEYEEEEGGALLGQLTSSRMGNVSAAETSHMFVSLLTEGSSIRYDSSMQVSVSSSSSFRLNQFIGLLMAACNPGGQRLQHYLSQHGQHYRRTRLGQGVVPI